MSHDSFCRSLRHMTAYTTFLSQFPSYYSIFIWSLPYGKSLFPVNHRFSPPNLIYSPKSFLRIDGLTIVDHLPPIFHFTMGCLTIVLASFGLLFPSIATASVIDKRAAVDSCLTSLKVPVYTSGTANLTQAVKPFNLRVTFTPAAYAVPVTVQDVQNAVSCGSQNAVTVTAKSGGHSYGSFGLGGEDGHLIVDMRNFNSVTVDQTAHTAIIGTGGRLGNVASALYSQGKQAISHGTCPGYVSIFIVFL
jgi:hypothetical protein